jgi:hypothetical protein
VKLQFWAFTADQATSNAAASSGRSFEGDGK